MVAMGDQDTSEREECIKESSLGHYGRQRVPTETYSLAVQRMNQRNVTWLVGTIGTTWRDNKAAVNGRESAAATVNSSATRSTRVSGSGESCRTPTPPVRAFNRLTDTRLKSTMQDA